MPAPTLHLITGACWLVLATMAWRAGVAASSAPRGAPPPALPTFRLESVLLPVALALHGLLAYSSIVQADGLHLGVANALSLIVWLTVAIYWLGGIAYPGLATIQGFWAPIAALAVGFQWLVPSLSAVSYGGDTIFALHFGIAMLSYSLFVVASVHAVVMLAEQRWLHRGVIPPFMRGLPPLLEMEALLFRILLAAFVLLTLTLATGVFFSEQLFGKAAKLNHKTVFGILSWLIFGALLAGRHFRGWRGKRAVYLTLGGSAALMLAYLGSKFVLEVVLQRA